MEAKKREHCCCEEEKKCQTENEGDDVEVCDCDCQKPEEKKVETIEEKVIRLESEVLSLSDKLLRNSAELANFKKRTQEEKVQDLKYASVGLINELLPVLSQLDMVCNMPTDNELLKNYLIGFKMVSEAIFNVLRHDGLEEIKIIDKIFDPKFHQATEKEKVDGLEPNKIVKEIQKGYTYKGRVIKPTLVCVSE